MFNFEVNLKEIATRRVPHNDQEHKKMFMETLLAEEINYRIVLNDMCFLKLGRNIPIDGKNNSRSRINRHFQTEAGCEWSKGQI